MLMLKTIKAVSPVCGVKNLNRPFPANIRLDEGVLKRSFVIVFRRRLDQDEFIRLTHTSSEDA